MLDTNIPNYEDLERRLLSARRLIVFANIAGPVSLLIGGVILSAAALICALIARSKINALLRECNPSQISFRQKVMNVTKSGAAAVVISTVALALNLITVIIFMPILLSAVQSGDMTSLIGGGGTTAAGNANSFWG